VQHHLIRVTNPPPQRRWIVTAWMAAAWTLTAGCTRDASPGGGVQHPLARYWSRPGPAVEIHGPGSGANGTARPAITTRLHALTPVLGIGALDGAPEQVFGEIADAAVDQWGRFVVLDARYNQLRLYDGRGRFIAAGGGPGAGPGEFQSPAALALQGDSTVWVLDRRAARVSRFHLGQDGFRFVDSFQLRVGGDDLCALGDHLFVYGLGAEGTETVHRYSAAGRSAGSFGIVYTGSNPLVRRQLLMGRLTCAEEDGLVLAMSNFLPEIRAYSADGALRWRSVFPDHLPILMEENAEGVRQGMPGHGRGYHYAASLVATTPGHAVVQLAHLTLTSIRSPYPFARLDTYVLDTRTGRGEHAGSDLPLLVYMGDRQALSARADPFPRLTLLADTADARR
jgi:hypothetical protein